MKTDRITVMNTGEGMAAALELAASAAASQGLTGKQALHLQLLTEELLGMFRQITRRAEASFWIESEGNCYQLHLAAHPVITGEMREDLLSVSTSGKNAAAVGVTGKLRDIFERAFLDESDGTQSAYSRYYIRGLLVSTDPEALDPMTFALNASLDADTASWSLQKYKASLEQEQAEDSDARKEWDELEKSIIASIADEVSVYIRSGAVEMTVYKTFA